MTAPRRARPIALFVIFLTFVATVAGLAGGYLMFRGEKTDTPVAAIGGPFDLVDHTGKPRTDADFRGRLLLVYFGYTNCPDVCPIGLQTMAAALDAAGGAADKVVPIFITVDPARDTVAVLRDYVPLFHPRLVGLTGSSEQVAAALKAYRVYAARSKGTGESGTNGGADEDYLMDHSVFTYLMGPDGRYLAHFRHGTPPAEIAARIRAAR